jgi:shikimate kinase
MQYDYMINEVSEVEDANASKGYGRGERREDYADAWRDTGTVVLVGLPGSGKAALAELLAGRTGLGVVVPEDADAALAALSGSPSIVVLSDALVENGTVQPHIHGAGKVFYLMADTKTLAARMVGRDKAAGGTPDPEIVWRALSARLAVMEPMFYGVLHFIMQGVNPPEELVEDALEKVAF